MLLTPCTFHGFLFLYGHTPQALITASMSATFTLPSPLMSEPQLPGTHGPQALMTPSKSVTLTVPSGLPAGEMSAAQSAGPGMTVEPSTSPSTLYVVSVMSPFCGARLMVNRKLYKVPQRSALALMFWAKVSVDHSIASL